jgi:hypothetical protein
VEVTVHNAERAVAIFHARDDQAKRDPTGSL